MAHAPSVRDNSSGASAPGPISTATAPSAPPPRGLVDHQHVVLQPLTALHPAPRNPRTHSRTQIRQLAASIRQFGFINPILVDGDHQVIAGHGRLAAARELGLAQVPTLAIAHLSPDEQRAYVLADNRLAELAGWDRPLLAVELLELSRLELDFELEITGFDTPALDVLFAELDDTDAVPEPPIPEPPAGPTVVQPGDLWQIGPHRLACADALDAASYTTLLAGEPAQLVFTDPPYNVPINGHVSGLGQHQHTEFAMACGELSSAEFTAFLRTVLEHLATVSVDGALHYVCMDWRHLGELLGAGEAVYSELKNLCVWVKSNGGMGSLYRSQHELIAVYKVGTAAHVNNVELGRHGRYRTNVWQYPGVNTFGTGRDQALAWHPTVKPLALIADALRDASRRGTIVLDAFAGSGTTLVAAAQTGRRGYGLELEPRYCEVILQRLTEATGEVPEHLDSDQSYAERAAALGQAGSHE